MAKKEPEVIVENIKENYLADALSERYLAYAMSTIVSRSLPDVRDGLKPVHRRLLYAMRQLKLDQKSGFKKCARVVGDVMGKYHPHGDIAIYDAMVRLAQSFSVRYPLVDGQGNFGNIDGDSAAAMRYTEARLTEAAMLLMQGLDEDAIDFRDTYDEEDSEPVVMPAAFPNILANGALGIAVGMATNIPPHNISEICDALQQLIKNRETTVAGLMKYIKGPDFPTGGVVVESPEHIRTIYETGRGGMRVRAKWEKEELSHGQYQIIITEIPYQVAKSELIKKIADMMYEKKLPFISDIRDESSEDIRVVIEPKTRSVAPELVMEQLFKLTDLESRFNMNMNVLNADGVPGVMDIKQVLEAFLSHRMTVLERTSEFRLDKIRKRMEILEGLLIAYLNLDEVIKIIRNEDDAKAVMMKKFKLTEVQVEAILNMRLRALRKLEEIQIKSEHSDLDKEKNELEELLKKEELKWARISGQIAEVKAVFGLKTALGKRRSEIAGAPDVVDVPIEALVEKEPITVLLSEKYWIKALKGHQEVTDGVGKLKDGDELKYALCCQTTDKIMMFADNGRFYTIAGDRIQRGRGFGEPLRLMIDLPENANIIAMYIYKEDTQLLLVSKKGKGFVVKAPDTLAQTKNGRAVMTLPNNEKAILCTPTMGDSVAIIGDNRKMLIFKLEEIPVLQKGQGVILQKYTALGTSDVKLFTLADGLFYADRHEKSLMPWLGKRAGQGRLPPVGFPRTNKF